MKGGGSSSEDLSEEGRTSQAAHGMFCDGHGRGRVPPVDDDPDGYVFARSYLYDCG